MRVAVVSLCLLGLAHGAAGTAAQRAAWPLPVASPASQGVSEARLGRLHEFLERVIESGDYLGAVSLVARNGRIVDWHAVGYRDLARESAMDRNAIFRIYSMTKTVTSVAVLMLMEEGKLDLEEPIAKFLPGFANMKVFAGGTADAPVLRPAARAMTIRQLLTHTAGLAAAGIASDELLEIYRRAALGDSKDLREYAEALSRLPLAADPGERFGYDGVSIEVLSRLVEVISGMPVDIFLQQRIFTPLALEDTGFSVPASKRGRLVDLYSTAADGKLVAAFPRAGAIPGERMNPYVSGAGGLYSTAADYVRFCQMLLNGGELDGVSLLARKTVELMMLNHLSHLNPPTRDTSAAEGFGLGGSVRLDVARAGRLGSVGQFGWSGAASTYFTIDRQERLVAILLLQYLPQGARPGPPRIQIPFYNLVYQSLAN